MPEFKSAKCPSCGGSLQVPDDREHAKCMYCSNDFVVKEAVAAAGVNLEALKDMANTALKGGDATGALRYWERVLEADSTNADAWFQKGLLELKLSGRTLMDFLGDDDVRKELDREGGSA